MQILSAKQPACPGFIAGRGDIAVVFSLVSFSPGDRSCQLSVTRVVLAGGAIAPPMEMAARGLSVGSGAPRAGFSHGGDDGLDRYSGRVIPGRGSGRAVLCCR